MAVLRHNVYSFHREEIRFYIHRMQWEFTVNQGCRQRSIKYLEKARIPKTNRITVSMNGKYPSETRSAVLCLVKWETEIQVEKNNNNNKKKTVQHHKINKLQYSGKGWVQGFFNYAMYKFKIPCIKSACTDFFSPNHTKKIHWERSFTLK